MDLHIVSIAFGAFLSASAAGYLSGKRLSGVWVALILAPLMAGVAIAFVPGLAETLGLVTSGFERVAMNVIGLLILLPAAVGATIFGIYGARIGARLGDAASDDHAALPDSAAQAA